MTNMRFLGVTLNVTDPLALESFYTRHLGFQQLSNDSATRLTGPDGGGILELRQSGSAEPYDPCPRDRYWKIGITVPDLATAVAQLDRTGIDVSRPGQFRDIGYLCHLADPEGFLIELLQHTFEGQPLTAAGNPEQPLGGGARLAHITLRTTDIDADLAHYRDTLGMRLLSIQRVHEPDFTLYFLGTTDESAPDGDVYGDLMRPWLWQRPYPLLEIQHWPLSPGDEPIDPSPAGDAQCGFRALVFGEGPS